MVTRRAFLAGGAAGAISLLAGSLVGQAKPRRPHPTHSPTLSPTRSPAPTMSAPPTAVPPPVTPAPFPWPSLQAAIDATAAGGTIDATGRTFTETVTIQKPLTIKGGTIDGQGSRTQWVRVWSSDVTLTDMAFRNAARGAVQSGSIDVSGARFRLIRPVAVSGSYAVLRLWTGSDGAFVEAADLSGARMGVIGWESHGSIIRGGRIHHNAGTADTGWESGGIKLGQSIDAQVIQLETDHNEGPGVWLDVYSSGSSITGCRAHDNTKCGLMVEIQDGFAVTDNTVYRNAQGASGNAFEMNGGIFISSSRRGVVSGNVVAWNGFGTTQPPASDITVVGQARDPRPHDGIRVVDNVLRRSPVFFTDAGDPAPVLAPNTIVADTDPRIAGLR